MNLKHFIASSWAAGKIGAGLSALLGAGFLLIPVLRHGLEHLSYDLPLALRPTVVADEAVIVYLDDLSHTALNQPYDRPWDRSLHAQLINRLRDYGARAIAFDILFAGARTNASADAALAQAIRDHGKVVLAADLGSGDYFGLGRETRLTLPYTNFITSAANWGFVHVGVDSDEVVREHMHGWSDLPSLSWRLASLLDLAVTLSPAEQNRRRWINYYGPMGTLKTISFSKALEPPDAALTNFFRGKVVFVGAGGTAGFSGERKDRFRDPFSLFNEHRSPGVDLHATMFLNLLRGDWLTRLPPWLELPAVIVFGLVAGCGLALWRPKRAVGLALVAMAVVAAAGVLAVWQFHIWFSWLVPCLIQIPVAAVCSLMFATERAAEEARSGQTRDFASPPVTPGQTPRIPDHELLRCIGRGGYGEVWLARSVLGAWRAVKIVHRESGGQRFEREFAGLKNFEPISRAHEGLVDILHVGRDDSAGCFYYVMELADDASAERGTRNAELPGRAQDSIPHSALRVPHSYIPHTLRHETSGPDLLPLNQCLQIGLALTGALDFLHQQGLIHRDLKPSNIIFIGGLPKLADIGLVAEIGEAKSYVGTEGYMPPEGPGTAQADLYSLGKLLYEVSTGLDWRQFPCVPPSEKWPEGERRLPLWEIIRKACEPDVHRRYAAAREMQADLLRLLGGGSARG